MTSKDRCLLAHIEKLEEENDTLTRWVHSAAGALDMFGAPKQADDGTILTLAQRIAWVDAQRDNANAELEETRIKKLIAEDRVGRLLKWFPRDVSAYEIAAEIARGDDYETTRKRAEDMLQWLRELTPTPTEETKRG